MSGKRKTRAVITITDQPSEDGKVKLEISIAFKPALKPGQPMTPSARLAFQMLEAAKAAGREHGEVEG
jgi:hypothetical protein